MKPAQRSRLVYLVLDGGSPVVESQVVGHLRFLHTIGLSFDLFLLGRAEKGLWGGQTLFNPERRAALEKQIGGRVVAATFANRLSGALLTLCLLFRHTFPACFTRRLVIQGRARKGAFLAIVFKWLCLGFPRIVCDMRGDFLAESQLEAKRLGARASRPSLPARFIEWVCLRDCAKVLYVSEAMRATVEARHPFARRRFGAVFPCLGDSALFHYDPQARQRARTELGLAEGELALIYAGGTQSYQCLEQTVRLFGCVRELHPSARLIVASSERDHAEIRDALARQGQEDAATLIAAPHERVPDLLNAADAGILLREPSEVNRAAAPTKFAEYALCGLPVAISEGIGDYSELASRERLGVVVERLDQLKSAAQAIVVFFEKPDRERERERIAAWAKTACGREARAEEYLRFHQTL